MFPKVFCKVFAVSLQCLCRGLQHLGSILAHLGASWAHLGSLLGPLGAILGASLLHDTLYVLKPIKTNGFLTVLVRP